MEFEIEMAERISHKIRIPTHIKKHHKTYILGGFSIFAIVQTFSLLFGAFSKASYEETNIPETSNEVEQILEIENSFQQEISGSGSIFDIFSNLFELNSKNKNKGNNGNTGNTNVEDIVENQNNFESQLATSMSGFDWDEGSFDKILGESLDLSKNNDFIQEGKFLKNLVLEQNQTKNNKIRVHIPKDVFAKHSVKDSKGGEEISTFTGTIKTPKELSKTFLEENNLEADYAFEIGDPETKIFFQDEEGGDSFIKISVELDPNDFSLGQKVRVKSSNDQVSRDNLGTYPVQQKIEDKKEILFVEFVVNHMTT
ncbi:MAG TPA: hypothetical protein PLP73_04670, partial [Candidatus Absconditabacterales bacterium]|nr:hypothetical protein [Candidatus Absconditabacterales bacterium]